ncbi:MAG: metal ABC transporter permease [Bacillota bacterium]
MEVWNELISRLLPFSWSEHFFMQNALLAVVLVTPLFGMLGTMVVNNRMAFFSDTIGHSALTGIAIGVILGLDQPLWAMIIFGIFMALTVTFVKYNTSASTDTILGIFSSTAVALGIVILSRGGGFNKYSRFLIGDLLSISPGEIKILALTLVFFLIYWFFFFNRFLLISIHSSFARSRGINVRLIEISFTVCLAIIVSVSIQWVGLLIINSLLILPAATARNFTVNMRQYHFVSIALALVSGIMGLILSYYWDTATGATIVLVMAFGYFVSMLGKYRFN